MPRKKKAREEEVYHVEVITKARVSEEGEWEYLVKWAGYDSDADSWEPSGNVQQCNRLLASFWHHVGMDDRDYHSGYEIAAEENWINKEKRYFAETFNKPSKRKSGKATKKERRKSKSSISESTADDSQSSDDESLAKTPVEKKLKKKAPIVETESESDSDGHLHKQVNAPLKATAPPPKVPAQAKRQEMPSATDGSLLIAPPKVTVVRTHQDQRTNPLVKSMDLPSESVEAGSLLSTKQRVAAGIPPPPTGPKPLPLGPKKSLPSLSFKKNKLPVPPNSQIKDTTMPNTSVAVPTSPVAQPTGTTNDADVSAFLQPMDIDQPIDISGSILDDARPPSRSSEILTVSIPPKSQEETSAEEFLKTIDIPVLSGPLHCGGQREGDVIADWPDQSTTELPKTLAIPKIPKKWKWSGDLFITTSESKTELLCVATIADPSGISNSSYINLLLSSLDSLWISKLYSIMDLSPLLRACGKPQYFGRLESNEPSEEVMIDGLQYYLTKERLAAIIPLLLDGTEVAVLVVFSRAQQKLTEVIQVPEHLLSGTPLLVVLFPLLVSTMTSTKAAGWSSIKMVQQSLLDPQDVLMPHDPPQEAMLYQAMSLLCFPKALLDFLNSSSTSRPYCIWPMPDQLSPGLDTIMLQYILKSTKAVSAKLEEDIRVIFISNRHLEILHTMPSLVTKRINSPELQFWTYGYSASITHERWRVQEIYPLGGIVTFTPSALVEDLASCHQLISKIIEHPLWECYLIPEVVAVSHLLSNNRDLRPLSESRLGPILDFINLGLISVTRMPSKCHSGQAAWLSQVFNHSSAVGPELLEVYLGVLRSQCITPGMTTEQLISFTNNEIIKDLSSAQIQPALMENYRRFVVIRAASEDAIPFDKDGLEWSPISQFHFKDDYFQLLQQLFETKGCRTLIEEPRSLKFMGLAAKLHELVDDAWSTNFEL